MPSPATDRESQRSTAAPGCGIIRVRGTFRVGKLLGSGTFGDVYLGWNIMTGQEVALKLQKIAKTSVSRLYHEQAVYSAISGCEGIPRIHWYGKEGPYEVIVLDRLGTSLSEIGHKGRLDVSTVFSFAKQMLSTLESLHARHYIHRDVKPENFMTGAGDLADQIFLIDFGLAKLFRNPATRLHIPQTGTLDITGTLRYTSINSHLGNAQSRRDDLESLVYTIVFLACGSLPWQDMRVRSTGKRKATLVLQKKKATSANALCRGLPRPFVDFVNHVRSLGFQDKPDYPYLHSLLLRCDSNAGLIDSTFPSGSGFSLSPSTSGVESS